MADTTVNYTQPASPDKAFTAESFGGSPEVVAERVQLVGNAIIKIAEILNSNPTGTEYGLIVRDVLANAIKTALEIIDDWDESDRAKVNPIVAQVGVTGGAGAVAANTQRVTLASDDPAVAALQIVDDWDETNRAAVNPIAGQAGVQGGAGAVTALTQRVAIATDANDVDITSAAVSTFDHGSNLDIDTAAEQITTTSITCKYGVQIKADDDNTGDLYIGNSDVTAGTTAATDGFRLKPGQGLFVPVDNANKVYAIASANNQKAWFLAI